LQKGIEEGNGYEDEVQDEDLAWLSDSVTVVPFFLNFSYPDG